MASEFDIATVRQNTDESTANPFDDDLIGDLLDANGIDGASAIIWERKAAMYAHLVDVSEAGSSHAFGDLQEKALLMAKTYRDRVAMAVVGRVKVKVIERS